MNEFPYYITKYFGEYLPLHVGVSPNTGKSYRDTFVQLLTFMESQYGIKPEKVILEVFTADKIEAFLLYLEEIRKVSVSSRNQRLAAIHSFCKYLQKKELSCFERCASIIAIPYKKTPEAPVTYLSLEEAQLLFSLPDTKGKKGVRDLTIMILLYETGARVQELLELTRPQIKFGNTPSVELHGKGNKSRLVPISHDVADISKNYMMAYNIEGEHELLFTNNRHEVLTRAGIQFIISKYVEMGRKIHPDYYRKKISSHSFRHSKAMHLLEAGVNLIYIRDFLGHASITTTEIYAKTNPDIKRKYITENSASFSTSVKYSHKEKEDLLNWLKRNI
jgi:site-specific recombinase XerD